MDSGEEQVQHQQQLELAMNLDAVHPAANLDDFAALTRQSERLIANVSANLDALNAALDRLEERTERVLLELQRLIGPSFQPHGPQDGCGDRDASA
ncbi:hypothetical protein KR009_006135 [Drosophila setifemur]|nr:hypothetical protein KR009_006135 [Drosophila setifemur]